MTHYDIRNMTPDEILDMLRAKLLAGDTPAWQKGRIQMLLPVMEEWFRIIEDEDIPKWLFDFTLATLKDDLDALLDKIEQHSSQENGGSNVH